MLKFWHNGCLNIFMISIIYCNTFAMQEKSNMTDLEASLKIFEDATLNETIEFQSYENSKTKRTRRTSYRNQPQKYDDSESSSSSKPKESQPDNPTLTELRDQEQKTAMEFLARILSNDVNEAEAEEDPGANEISDLKSDEDDSDSVHAQRADQDMGTQGCFSLSISRASNAIGGVVGPIIAFIFGKRRGS